MRLFVLPLILIGACVCAQAQQVKVYPRIETGTHAAIVKRVDLDAGERFLFSASYDKTARVWDLRSGRLLKILRPPIGDGEEGELYAVASSPDGAAVAVGGFTAKHDFTEFPVYIFDRESGDIRKTIRGLPSVVSHLAYSKDGRYLAVAVHEQNGIRIYNSDGYSEVARDEKYGDDSYWLEFDKSGRLVTTSFDGYVRLYSSDFRLLHKEKAPGGTDPVAARFSPDGRFIAVGFKSTMAVDVLSANDLSFLYTLSMPPESGALFAALWSTDGRTVCAGGTYIPHGVSPVLCWSDAGKGKLRTFPVAGSTIMDIRALKDGAIAFCSADGSVGVLDRTGVAQWRAAPDLLEYRTGSDLFHVSSDGNDFETFGYYFNGATWTGHKISFSVSDERLDTDSQSNISLQPPATTGLAIDRWKDGYNPTLDGRALGLGQTELSRSLAISPDKNSFILGTQWYVRKFDRQGKPMWRSAADGVYGVNITTDGRFVIAALGDGTVRWYTFEKGEEVLALFVDRNLQGWVAWNPDGFFTFKGGGDALIGYQINHGADQAGEFVNVDQLREVFYRADLIDQILKPGGAAKVLAARNRVGDISKVLAGGLPPEIELVSAAQEGEAADRYLLQFRVKDLGGGRGRIVYRIDGVEIEGREVDIAGTGGDTISRYIPIGSGEHTLTVAAYSADGKILGQPRTVQIKGRQLAQGSKTSLYVIAAGITHYSDHSLWDGVKFAAADADLVAAKFKEQEGKGLYPKVTTVSLEDSKATVKGIQNAIALAAKSVQAGDTFVLYLAGHGMAVEGEYYFIPWEAEYTNRTELLSKSLNRESIQALLKTIPTNKSVLILDTCNSGAFVEGRDAASEKAAIEKVATMSGRAVLAASNSDEMAMDGYLGHGVFTFALLEGLGAADSDAQGQILITRLAEYVQRTVPNMTEEKWHYRQRPLSAIKGDPFPIVHKAAN
jgi:WD40 repeat protein